LPEYGENINCFLMMYGYKAYVICLLMLLWEKEWHAMQMKLMDKEYGRKERRR
jgi:hypothetical protein